MELAVATADRPSLILAVEQLTGLRVEPIVCPPALIAASLQRWYPGEIEPGILYRAAGDNLFVISDRSRGIRPALPELLRADAASSDWLRAIGGEAMRRGSRRIRIEPHGGAARAALNGSGDGTEFIPIPRGAYPGIMQLLEGISGMAARGRVGEFRPAARDGIGAGRRPRRGPAPSGWNRGNSQSHDTECNAARRSRRNHKSSG